MATATFLVFACMGLDCKIIIINKKIIIYNKIIESNHTIVIIIYIIPFPHTIDSLMSALPIATVNNKSCHLEIN